MYFLSFRILIQWIPAGVAINLVVFVSLLLSCFQAAAAPNQSVSGVVTRVVDGDTLWLKTSATGRPLKVRIQGVDAPEICQSGGAAARQALQRRVLGRTVTLEFTAYDDYGRALGVVDLQGQDVGRWLVAQGYAWTHSYRHIQSPYASEMKRAQLARRGVFAEVQPEDPRGFRRRRGSCGIRR